MKRRWEPYIDPLILIALAVLSFFLFFYRLGDLGMLGPDDATPKRRVWFYLSYASLGLGTLAKGPVAFLLAMASTLCFLAVRGAWDEWRTWHPEGLFIGVAIALPWYVACTWLNGYEFI